MQNIFVAYLHVLQYDNDNDQITTAGTASSQGTVGPVIERMDASINTAENDFPVPQRTGNSCDVKMPRAIKNPSIHISDFPTGMRSPPWL